MTLARASVPLPDPPLADEVLVLRPWRIDDAATLAAAWEDPAIARWTGVPAVTGEAAAQRWIGGDADRRAHGLALDLVVERCGEVVGEVGLADIDPRSRTAEIGWWIAAGHRGEGLASRAVRLVAAWAVEELVVNAVLARCHRRNPASGAVARSAGFAPVDGSGEIEVWRFA